MFQITINEKGGQATQQSFDKNEITIGRVQGNDVVLPKGNISKRHSRIVLKDGKFIIVDLKSTNGTYVNGKKITAPQVIKATDKIYIGDYTLQLANGAGASPQPESREQSTRAKTGGRDEIDLFGGEAAADEPAAAPAPAKGGSPGLIDDNFDQEFDVAAEAPQPKASKGMPAPAKPGKLPAPAKAPEPEPDLDAPSDGELELEGNNLGMGDDMEAQGDMDADMDPDPPKAPVVPMKPPKKGGSSAPQPRLQPSKVQPAKMPAPAKQAKPSPIEDDASEDASEELELAGDPAPAAAAATARPSPAAPPPPVLAPVAAHAQTPSPVVPLPVQPVMQPAPQIVAMPAMAQSAGAPLDRREAIHELHLRIVNELGLRGYDLSALGSMRDKVTSTARTHAQRMQNAGRIDAAEDLDAIAKSVASLALDMDLISALYSDDNVVQILITHDRQMWAERESLRQEITMISSEDQVVDLIRRLGVLGGADPGPKHPLVDVRLRDGTRVVGVLPPLAFRGPTISIRKSTRDAYLLDSFVESGTLSEPMVKFIDFCVRNKKNMLLSLGPGVSGSATLNALAAGIADDERVVTIESGVELHLHNLKNVTALEPSKDVGLGMLIKHAALMQPDHVIIGNIHGPDVFDVVSVLGGQVDGSVASYPASSPQEAVERLAHVELASRLPDSPAAAKRLIASAFPIIIQEHRFPEGASRKITAISEVVIEGEEVTVQDIFVFKPERIDDNGMLDGKFAATGHEPRFVQELVDRGDEFDTEIFKE